MKKFGIILSLFALGHLQAQTTGVAASETATAAKESGWQNWTFAGVALIVAASAVYIVSLNSGHSADSD
jgi:hypothetical protein